MNLTFLIIPTHRDTTPLVMNKQQGIEHYYQLCSDFTKQPNPTTLVEILGHENIIDAERKVGKYHDNGIHDLIYGISEDYVGRVICAQASLPTLCDIFIDLMKNNQLLSYQNGDQNIYVALIIDRVGWTLHRIHIVPLLLNHPDGYKYFRNLRYKRYKGINVLIERGCENNDAGCMYAKIKDLVSLSKFNDALDLLLKFRDLGYDTNGWLLYVWICQNKLDIEKYVLTPAEKRKTAISFIDYCKSHKDYWTMVMLYRDYPEECQFPEYAKILYYEKMLKYTEVAKWYIPPMRIDWENAIECVSSGIADSRVLEKIDPKFIHAYMDKKIKALKNIKNLGIANAMTSKILEFAF